MNHDLSPDLILQIENAVIINVYLSLYFNFIYFFKECVQKPRLYPKRNVCSGEKNVC